MGVVAPGEKMSQLDLCREETNELLQSYQRAMQLFSPRCITKCLNSLTSWRRIFSVDIQLAKIFSTSAESEGSREVWPLPSSYNAFSGFDRENGFHIWRAAANVPLSCREQPTSVGQVVWSLGLSKLTFLRRLKYEMIHRAMDVTSQMTANACDGHCCTERSTAFAFFRIEKLFKAVAISLRVFGIVMRRYRMNCEKRLSASSCLSVLLSSCINSAMTGRIYVKSETYENLCRISKFG